MSKKRKLIYDTVSICIILGTFILGSLLYPALYERTFMGVKELGNSFVWYIYLFVKGFGIEWNLEPLVKESTYINGLSFSFLPKNWSQFWYEYWISFRQLFSGDYATRWFNKNINSFSNFAEILLLGLPLIIVFALLFRTYFDPREPAIGVKSKWLVRYEKLVDWFSDNIVFNVKDFLYYFRNKKRYFIPFVIEALYFLNFINIGIGVIAYYLYFIGSFDLSSIWMQIVRLFCDISHLFRKEFVPLWVLFFGWLFVTICRHIAQDRKDDALNRCYAFVKEDIAISSLLTGVMGTGKTTLMSDLTITCEQYFMDVALDKITEYSSYFPDYDWRSYENWIEGIIQSYKGSMNLSHIKKELSKRIPKEQRECVVQIGGELLNLYDVLITYGELYWVYTLKSSKIYGNISVRSGLFVVNEGHLPCYGNDFNLTTVESFESSNYAHIIPFDGLRTGKKINDYGKFNDSLDIGIFLIDEFGKERKNQTELEGVNKAADETNQKNDGFNYSIKMGRHMSTIDNFPFFRIFSADQRLSSVPADAKELNNTIIEISKKPETKNFYPLYFYWDWILTGLDNFFVRQWQKFRFARDDETLIFHFIKKMLYFIKKQKRMFFNVWGVKILEINMLNSEGIVIGHSTYPLVVSKIYMKRFATDAYADFYSEKGMKSKYCIEDVPSYKNVKADIDELKQQESYFINDLTHKSEEKQKKKSTYIKSPFKDSRRY